MQMDELVLQHISALNNNEFFFYALILMYLSAFNHKMWLNAKCWRLNAFFLCLFVLCIRGRRLLYEISVGIAFFFASTQLGAFTLLQKRFIKIKDLLFFLWIEVKREKQIWLLFDGRGAGESPH